MFPGVELKTLFASASQAARFMLSRYLVARELWEPLSPERELYLETQDPRYSGEKAFLQALSAELAQQWERALSFWEEIPEPGLSPRKRLLRVLTVPPPRVLEELLEGEPEPTPHLLWIAAARSLTEGWERVHREGLLVLFDLYPPPSLFPPAFWLLPAFLTPPLNAPALLKLLKPLRETLPGDLFFLELEILVHCATRNWDALTALLTSLEHHTLPEFLALRNLNLLLDLFLYEFEDGERASAYLAGKLPHLPRDPALLIRGVRLALSTRQKQLLLEALKYLKEVSPPALKEWLPLAGYELVVRLKELKFWEELAEDPCAPYTLLALRQEGRKEEWLKRLREYPEEQGGGWFRRLAQHLLIRDTLMGKNDRQQSWLLLGKALEDSPEDPSLLRLKLEVCEATRRYKELLETLEKLANLTTDPKERLLYRFRQAELYETILGEDGNAERLYEELLSHYPGFLPAITALERIYRRNRNFAKLAELLKTKYEHLDEKGARIHTLEELYTLGSELLNDPDLALSALEQLIPLEPENLALLYEHLRLALEKEDPRRTLKLLKGLLYSGTLPNPVLARIVRLWAELTLALYQKPEALVERFREHVPLFYEREWALRVRGGDLKRFVERHGVAALREEQAAVPEGEPFSHPWLRTLPKEPDRFAELVTTILPHLPPGQGGQILGAVEEDTPLGRLFLLAQHLSHPPEGFRLWQGLPREWQERFHFWLTKGSFTLTHTPELIPHLFPREGEGGDSLACALALLKAGEGKALQELLGSSSLPLREWFQFLLPPLLLREGEEAKAAELLASAYAPPEAFAVYALYGELLRKFQHHRTLLSLLDALKEELPDPSLRRLVPLLKAQLRYEMGEKGEAFAELERALPELEGEGESLPPWLEWLDRGYPPEESARFRISAAREPFPRETRIALYREAGERAEGCGAHPLALEGFQGALALDPGLWEVREKLRELYRALGEEQEKRIALLSSGLDHPAPPEVRQRWYLELAELCAGSTRDLEFLERALKEQPEWIAPYRLLLERYPEESQQERRLALWEKLVTLSDDPLELARGYAVLGNAALARGDLAHARELLKKSLSANPLQGEALESLFALSQKLKEEKEFLAFLQNYKTGIPRKETAFLLRVALLEARVARELGEREKAMEILKEALVLEPRQPELLRTLVELSLEEHHPRSAYIAWARTLVRLEPHLPSLGELLNQVFEQRRYDQGFVLASLLRAFRELSSVEENLYRQGLKPLSAPQAPFEEEAWKQFLSELSEIPLPRLKIYYFLGEALSNAKASYVEARPQEEKIRPGGEILKRWQEWCSWRGVEGRDWYRGEGLSLPQPHTRSRNALVLPPWESQEHLFLAAMAAQELALLSYPLVFELSQEEREEYARAVEELGEGKGLFSGKSRSPKAKLLEENLPRKARKELEELLQGVSGSFTIVLEDYERVAASVMALLAPDPGALLKEMAQGKPLSEALSEPFPRLYYSILLREHLGEFRVRLKVQK